MGRGTKRASILSLMLYIFKTKIKATLKYEINIANNKVSVFLRLMCLDSEHNLDLRTFLKYLFTSKIISLLCWKWNDGSGTEQPHSVLTANTHPQ